jgi:hypothetical protein
MKDKTYDTVGTITKWNIKIVERVKYTPNLFPGLVPHHFTKKKGLFGSINVF